MLYKDAGVDIEAGDNFNKYLQSNFKIDLGFAAELDISKYNQPILITSTDGVGTKLLLALKAYKYYKGKYLYDIGLDLAAMVFNDIICQGATPLGLLDYIGTPSVNREKLDSLIKGIVEGCAISHAKLLGGETAELYNLGEDELELAGFGIGIKEKADTFMKAEIKSGDIIMALESNGVHSNGFSLIKKVTEENKIDLFDIHNKYLLDNLLTPTKNYVKKVRLLKDLALPVKALANITGGGIRNNIKRVIPPHLKIKLMPWEIPNIFQWIEHTGGIERKEMFKTFNMGIGMIFIIPEDYQNDIPYTMKIGELE